ncbi:MAG: hypothetical protein K2W85_11805, partial [Phycisphaerales bacterium]|nr:hypothetical protein [Phycisphaerales bacterium]
SKVFYNAIGFVNNPQCSGEGAAFMAAVRGVGQRLQLAAYSFAVGAAMLLIAVPIVLSGIWLLAASLMWWLETLTTRPLAAAATGVVMLMIGVGIFMTFRLLTLKARP